VGDLFNSVERTSVAPRDYGDGRRASTDNVHKHTKSTRGTNAMRLRMSTIAGADFVATSANPAW